MNEKGLVDSLAFFALTLRFTLYYFIDDRTLKRFVVDIGVTVV